MTGLFPAKLRARAADLVARCRDRGWLVATAESCTGGLVAGLLTEVAGSSAVVDRGFVTYSNEAKADMLGIPWDMLMDHGAVSRPIAEAMALGALAHSRAAVAISITGIAGPGGGSAEKPVGLVHFAMVRKGEAPLHAERRFGDIGRTDVRLASVEQALDMIETALSSGPLEPSPAPGA